MEGLICGSYGIIKRIGEGGMAEVWLAKHRMIDQYAAVKLLRPHMTQQPQLVKRFIKEAQAAAAIKHPSIVRIVDVGYTADGRAYIAMELLEGETLKQRLKRTGAMDVGDAVRWIQQIAGVMEAAHTIEIIHRDLKPDNIFVVPDPEVPGGERIKVLDFGLAKLTTEMAGSLVTARGTIFGTPAYMAPEQCLNTGGVDERADVYAIGCIFFHCLCGRPPFVENETLALIRAQISQPPPVPSTLREDLPGWVDGLISRLLAKELAQRIPSCSALLEELESHVGQRAGSYSAETTTLVDLDPDDTRRSSDGTSADGHDASADGHDDSPTLVTLGHDDVFAHDAALEVTENSPTRKVMRQARPGSAADRTPMPPPSGQRLDGHVSSISSGVGQVRNMGVGQHTSQRRKRSRGLVAGIIAAVLVVGVAVVGFIWSQRGTDGGVEEANLADDSSSREPEPTQADQPSPSPVVQLDPIDAGTRDATNFDDSTAADEVGEDDPDEANGAAELETETETEEQPSARSELRAEQIEALLQRLNTSIRDSNYREAFSICGQLPSHARKEQAPSRECTMAACELKKASRARRYFKYVHEEGRSNVRKFCMLKGVEMPADSP